ncbi:Secondary glycine betaine transporter BetU (plasmid) [Klebsiella pneumoniae]|nr:Secondary glycine betaine transporter BetU [Klebsiella pneumoniae]
MGWNQEQLINDILGPVRKTSALPAPRSLIATCRPGGGNYLSRPQYEECK